MNKKIRFDGDELYFNKFHLNDFSSICFDSDAKFTENASECYGKTRNNDLNGLYREAVWNSNF